MVFIVHTELQGILLSGVLHVVLWLQEFHCDLHTQTTVTDIINTGTSDKGHSERGQNLHTTTTTVSAIAVLLSLTSPSLC